MRHSYFGRKLSRTKNERRRLFQGLIRDLILHGMIRTTKAKAKAVQPIIEQLVTKAKKNTDVAYRSVLRILDDGAISRQLMDDAKERFSARTSGYTRIVAVDGHRGDASVMAMLSFVDERKNPAPQPDAKKENVTKQGEKSRKITAETTKSRVKIKK